MTKEEFYQKLSKTKGWVIRQGTRSIRRFSKKDGQLVLVCPIAHLANRKIKKVIYTSSFLDPARVLGLAFEDANKIADGADRVDIKEYLKLKEVLGL